ncbi:hypothetical protein LSH36_1204g00008 [Paralvinella palmiformis]|uniref:Uncharacterized protein n=1 Tax=Paralvinella palmiformis TaxID=53620 RepID=A0AAD9IU64_9ANNE|nr:hypothetical protein LSH36_1204g00008 [Paralvinella palmiformis]
MKLILMTVIAVLCAVSWGEQAMPCFMQTYNECRLTSMDQCSDTCGPGSQTKYFNCKKGQYGGGRYRCTDTCYGYDCPEGCDFFFENGFCRRKAYGRCSKTCGVGTFTTRFLCANKNYTCTTPCCCSQCEPGGSGNPSVLCKDVDPVPDDMKDRVCPNEGP